MPCSSKYIGGKRNTLKRSTLKRSTQKREKKQQGGFVLNALSKFLGYNTDKPTQPMTAGQQQNQNQNQQMTAGQQLNQNQQMLQQLQQLSGGKRKGKSRSKK